MLAGIPSRLSTPPVFGTGIVRDGFIKVRLGHSSRGTVIVPDMIFVKARPWRFLQPSFFGPCAIGFNVEPNLHIAKFSVDVGAPRSRSLVRLGIQMRSDSKALSYPDGSQLYACNITGPRHLAPFGSGRSQRLASGDFAVELFHHTGKAAYSGICASQELWSSTWNLQGTRRLKNVAYVYLTNLPKIEHPDDLTRIAMSSNGVLRFQTTSNRPTEEIVELTVYRESTVARTHAIQVGVPTSLLAPPHIYLHPFVPPNPAYYEIVGPEIFRVGLMPNAKLPIPCGVATPDDNDLKSFEYVVMGDAGSSAGLAAPYDEENTSQIMHHERLDKGIDLFDFWLANANSDQMDRAIHEPRAFQ